MTAVLTPSPAAPSRYEMPAAATPGRVSRLWRGRSEDPAWVRPSVLALLAATAVLYLWGIGQSGWANSFYSAAGQAGAESWKAFFYGSLDAGNAITVDKPPAALWLMALSVRVFGLHPWAIALPQALAGIGAVGLLYSALRRALSPAAGLVAGAVLALTPVAALMFRFNNPDALLVLLMVAAAWAVQRAVGDGRTRWLVLAGVFIGLGFLTKQLQVLLVVPGLGLAYLVAGPPRLARRVWQLLAAGAAMVAAAGWWVAVVELVPVSLRPYIGGSQTNSFLELTFGYNGFGRLTGDETGSVGGGAGWGETGLTRLVDGEIGGQIAWLLPAALVFLVAAILLRGRRPRTDPARAAVISWGSWLLVTGLAFSLMSGIFHAYYTVALAPAVGALVGLGAVLVWRRRQSLLARLTLAGVTAGSAGWAFVLLGRSAEFLPWLRPVVLAAGLVSAVVLVVSDVAPRVLTRAGAALGLVAVLAGPAAYTVYTVGQQYTGSIVSAGPVVAAAAGGAPGGGGAGRGLPGQGFPGQGFPGQAGQGVPGQGVPGQGPGLAGQGARGGAAGGLLDASTPGEELVAALEQDAADFTWVAATVGANQAAGYQLATEEPVLAIGGFNGSDPAPTLAQFQAMVSAGDVHYFLAGGSGGFGGGQDGGSDAAAQIAAWVEVNFTAGQVDGVTVYDLTT